MGEIIVKKDTEDYSTLSFKNISQAKKNMKEIENYFNERIIESTIMYGVDERENTGFMVFYKLKTQ